MLFCGIDTSNYTTSAALCDECGRIIVNIKMPLPVKSGERGLRQSDAVFSHVRNIPHVMQMLDAALGRAEVTAVGVSATPRDIEDSYMPCFLAGIAAAESFAAGRGISVFRYSHQNGHIMAAFENSGASVKLGSEEPFLAFHVSGGTTELLLVRPSGRGFDIEKIGGTEDLNAGQAIDRVGVMLGMSFPCGPAMEREAAKYDGRIHRRKTSVRGLDCNLSGVENLARTMLATGADASEISAFVFDFIGRTLYQLAVNARERYGEIPVIWAGGVMSNNIIKKRLSVLNNVFFTSPEYSSDNAAGIALLCKNEYLLNSHADAEQ